MLDSLMDSLMGGHYGIIKTAINTPMLPKIS